MENNVVAIPAVRDEIVEASLLREVGSTPLIKLTRITSDLPTSVSVYAKAEWYNPSGSVKDRPAANMLRRAMADGWLNNDKVLLDSTSGNMGISFAMFAASLGLKLHLAIPSNASEQRFSILNIFGAEITKTDPLEGSDGARLVAKEMAAQEPDRFYFADQYKNPNNWKAHYASTGPEILTQSRGAVTHFVAGLGTSGTMMGTGLYMKEQKPGIRLIAVQPQSPLHGLEGLKDMQTSPHPEIYNPSLPDEVRFVSTEAAYTMVTRLAKEEGLLVGVSAGAAAHAAIEMAKELESGMIVVIFPDSGYKYLDLGFWNNRA
jgi:cysteine synthase B